MTIIFLRPSREHTLDMSGLMRDRRAEHKLRHQILRPKQGGASTFLGSVLVNIGVRVDISTDVVGFT